MIRKTLRIAIVLVLALAVALAGLIALYSVVSPVSTLMLWRWASGAPVTRTPVPIGRIDPALVTAVVASEDALFCKHRGVNWDDLREVIEEADEDGPSRGASTLTMQVAKNLFLWPGRSYVRKALEIPLALLLDLVWSKRRILEIYLNIAEWGPAGQFGAEAGARHAFNKGAFALTPREAALLAAVLPNPHVRSARRPGPRVERVAGIVAARAAAGPGVAACVSGRS